MRATPRSSTLARRSACGRGSDGERFSHARASLALRQLDREKEAFEALLAENREKMQKRMKSMGSDGGQTMYRQPDGTLAPNKPPRNPYTVAARRQFADLVHYCRITGTLPTAATSRTSRALDRAWARALH